MRAIHKISDMKYIMVSCLIGFFQNFADCGNLTYACGY